MINTCRLRARSKLLTKSERFGPEASAKRTTKLWPFQGAFVRRKAPKNAFWRFIERVKSIAIIRTNKFRLALKSLFYKSNQKLKLLQSVAMSKTALPSKMSGFTNQSVEQTPPAKRSILLVAMNFFHRFLILCVRFVMAKYYGERGASMPAIDDLILLESATALAEKIRTKKVSCTSVMGSFITRCKLVNPQLNCVVDNRFDDALKEAEEVDQLLASEKYTADELREQKPFLGVPISTKDCIEVNGMLHTSGLWLRRNMVGTVDADAIALMRAAGAIPFALTNVSECCMW